MLKSKPSEAKMELIKKISEEIVELAEKENQIEIMALMPYSLFKLAIQLGEEHKQWGLLIMSADYIAELSTLIDEVDIPLEELQKFAGRRKD